MSTIEERKQWLNRLKTKNLFPHEKEAYTLKTRQATQKGKNEETQLIENMKFIRSYLQDIPNISDEDIRRVAEGMIVHDSQVTTPPQAAPREAPQAAPREAPRAAPQSVSTGLTEQQRIDAAIAASLAPQTAPRVAPQSVSTGLTEQQRIDAAIAASLAPQAASQSVSTGLTEQQRIDAAIAYSLNDSCSPGDKGCFAQLLDVLMRKSEGRGQTKRKKRKRHKSTKRTSQRKRKQTKNKQTNRQTNKQTKKKQKRKNRQRKNRQRKQNN